MTCDGIILELPHASTCGPSPSPRVSESFAMNIHLDYMAYATQHFPRDSLLWVASLRRSLIEITQLHNVRPSIQDCQQVNNHTILSPDRHGTFTEQVSSGKCYRTTLGADDVQQCTLSLHVWNLNLDRQNRTG
jgi:hypothetical protein